MEKSFENYRMIPFKVTFLLDLTVGELSQVLHKTCPAKPIPPEGPFHLQLSIPRKRHMEFRHDACQCGKHTVNEHLKDN